MSGIAEKVKAIIIDKLGVDESEVTNEANFINDLGADSLDTVELIMEFEKEFDIDYDNRISLSRLDLCNSQNLVEMIVKEVSKLFTEAECLEEKADNS